MIACGTERMKQEGTGKGKEIISENDYYRKSTEFRVWYTLWLSLILSLSLSVSLSVSLFLSLSLSVSLCIQFIQKQILLLF